MNNSKKIIVMLIASSFVSQAYAVDALGVNFSNLSAGTVTNTTISQTGTGRSRISGGNALTFSTVAASGNSAATGLTVSEAADAGTAFTHVGTLTTLSLTQATSSASVSGTPGPLDNNENTISGSIYSATSGSVTVTQTGDANAVDFAIGVSGTPVTSPTIAITQTGSDNYVELTRTAGTNTDTIGTYGNGNLVKVSGSATGTNSANISLGSSGAATADNNQVTVSQTGSANTLTATVSADSNILDMRQSAATAGLTVAITGGSNKIYTNQSGAGSSGEITVNGDSNAVDLIQSGASANALITVTGNANNVDVTQSAASTYASLNISSTSASVAITQQTANASYAYAGTVPSGGSISVTQ